MPQEKDWFIENLNKNRMTPEEMYEASQRIAQQKKKEQGLPLFGNGVLGNLFGGTASLGNLPDFIILETH